MRVHKKLVPHLILLTVAAIVGFIYSSRTVDVNDEILSSEPVLYGPYAVERVVDGDTIYIINDEGGREKVRFIGVDTPESVHTDETKNSEEGLVASEFTKTLLSEKQVWLEYDIDRQDQYDRTLAYVYMNDGSSTVMVQELLLYHGLAQTMTIQPNSKYAEKFVAIQRDAQESGRGFWSN